MRRSTHTKPVAGWPVVVFQHGITGNRTQAAAIAGTYASQGFVVAAIDIALHGVTDPANPLFQDGAERTFDLDLVDNSTGATGPDGIIDPSGSYFINLSSLLTSRDNLRQSSIDIIQLVSALPSLDLDGDASPDIDGARIHFAGLSLGGMVGTVANAMPITTVSAYLNEPGGGVANLLRESATLGPRIHAGLEAAGLRPGHDALRAVLPRRADGRGRRRPDQLHRRRSRGAAGAAHAGDRRRGGAELRDTAAHQCRDVREDDDAGPQSRGCRDAARGCSFTEGSTARCSRPTASLAATTEMQTHAASLAASGGTAFAITNPAILEP